jgi:hypothetical protein
MKARARATALVPVWALVGTAGLAATLSFTAVQASRAGCIGTRVADFVAIGGIAGLGLAVSALLLVGAVPRYRAPAPAFGASAALALSLYAVVTLLAQGGAACGF